MCICWFRLAQSGCRVFYMVLKVGSCFFTFYTNAQDFNAFFNFFNYNYDGEEVEPHRWIEKAELNFRFFKRLKNNLNNLNQNVFSTLNSSMISMELISVAVLFVCLFVFLFFVSLHLITGWWTVRIKKRYWKQHTI